MQQPVAGTQQYNEHENAPGNAESCQCDAQLVAAHRDIYLFYLVYYHCCLTSLDICPSLI